jgi:hypothetical protein
VTHRGVANYQLFCLFFTDEKKIFVDEITNDDDALESSYWFLMAIIPMGTFQP